MIKLLLALLFQIPQVPPPPPTPIYPAAIITLEATASAQNSTFHWMQVFGTGPASFTDPDKAVTKVMLTVSGTYLFRVDVTNGPLSTYSYFQTTVAGGFQFSDPPDNGLTASIRSLPVFNNLDTQPPVIQSVKNTSNVDVTTGAAAIVGLMPMRFTVQASDNFGVSFIKLIIDNEGVAQAGPLTSPLPATTYLYWNKTSSLVTAGNHNVLLQVWDAVGNLTEKTWVLKK